MVESPHAYSRDGARATATTERLRRAPHHPGAQGLAPRLAGQARRIAGVRVPLLGSRGVGVGVPGEAHQLKVGGGVHATRGRHRRLGRGADNDAVGPSSRHTVEVLAAPPSPLGERGSAAFGGGGRAAAAEVHVDATRFSGPEAGAVLLHVHHARFAVEEASTRLAALHAVARDFGAMDHLAAAALDVDHSGRAVLRAEERRAFALGREVCLRSGRVA